jgi:hypothetical protein
MDENEGSGTASKSHAPANANRRASSRVVTNHNASCTIHSVRYTVEVRDISRSGAQICIRQGLMPSVGQLVTLCFMNHDTADARVVWTDERCAGLLFTRELVDCLDVVHFDDLGADYYRAVLKFQMAGG